jgi:hypothetical protein
MNKPVLVTACLLLAATAFTAQAAEKNAKKGSAYGYDYRTRSTENGDGANTGSGKFDPYTSGANKGTASNLADPAAPTPKPKASKKKAAATK